MKSRVWKAPYFSTKKWKVVKHRADLCSIFFHIKIYFILVFLFLNFEDQLFERSCSYFDLAISLYCGHGAEHTKQCHQTSSYTFLPYSTPQSVENFSTKSAPIIIKTFVNCIINGAENDVAIERWAVYKTTQEFTILPTQKMAHFSAQSFWLPL